MEKDARALRRADPMRRATLLALALLLAIPLADAGSTVVKAYVGSSTRDPVLGAHPICAVAGFEVNVGGACFEVPQPATWPYVTIHDDRSIGFIQLSIFSYVSDVGLPLDGKVFCVQTDKRFIPSMQMGQRLAIAIGPTYGGPETPCPGLPGTKGTITVQWS